LALKPLIDAFFIHYFVPRFVPNVNENVIKSIKSKVY
jgi:hypothetical protein